MIIELIGYLLLGTAAGLLGGILGIGGSAILIPVLIKAVLALITKSLETRYVANRSIEPNIKVFFWLVRNFKTKIGSVATYIPVL